MGILASYQLASPKDLWVLDSYLVQPVQTLGRRPPSSTVPMGTWQAIVLWHMACSSSITRRQGLRQSKATHVTHSLPELNRFHLKNGAINIYIYIYILYYIALYYTILYYIILYYIILHYIILYYVISLSLSLSLSLSSRPKVSLAMWRLWTQCFSQITASTCRGPTLPWSLLELIATAL